MPNPTHYPGLELCQRLKELGWSTETEKVWWKDDFGEWEMEEALSLPPDDIEPERFYPAPSIAEMLDQLGKGVRRVEFGPKATWVFPFGGNGEDCSNSDTTLSRADQLATCLINLAERGEIKM